MVLSAVHIVLSIFIMIGVGMYLTHLGWLNDDNSSLISRLVVKVALPGMIISNLFTSFTQESMLQSLTGLVAPILSILLSSAVAFPISRLAGIPKERRGVFSCMFVYSNSVFIGVPISLALFGESVMPYTLMYYIANTTLFWTLGVFLMRKDSGVLAEKGDFRGIPQYILRLCQFRRGQRDDPRQDGAFSGVRVALSGLARMFPIPLITFFLCFFLVLAGFQPPSCVMSAAKYIGNMVTPLSLFFTSIVIMRMLRTGRIRWQRGYAWMLAGRFIISPLLMYGCAAVFRMPELMRNVLIVQAAMPVMSQTPIVAGGFQADTEYAAGGMALSTLLSLVFIPLYMAIL